MAPQIAIVLPVYNGQAYLKNCLDGIQAQSVSDYELVVSDDGSTDGSQQIVRAYGDPRWKTIRGPGRGLFANLNSALPHVSAPIVRFLCQDDVLDPECLERELDFFAQHPEVALCTSKFAVIDERGEAIERSTLNDLPDVLEPSLAVQHFFYHGCIASNLSTVALRRAVLSQVGVFDEALRVSGDYELWARIACRHPIGILHRHVLQVRRHAMQLSRSLQSSVAFVSENQSVRDRLRPYLPSTVQDQARSYEIARHGVLDFHLSLHLLLRGHFRQTIAIWKQLGLRKVAQSAGMWLWTWNNRRHRPQAPWVIDHSAA